MNEAINWLWSASPIELLAGLVVAAFFVRVIIDIIKD